MSSHPTITTGSPDIQSKHTKVISLEKTISVPNVPVLQKKFNLWSTLGLTYSITATPIGITTFLAFTIGIGGPPYFIFGFIVSAIFNLCICASLAEIAAVFPHASGQAFWTSSLAPATSARFLSYWAGAFASAAWFFFTAGTYLFSSLLVFALVEICDPDFASQPYQVYLLYVGFGILSTFFNITLFRFYPTMLKGLVYVINGGAIFLLVSLLIRVKEKQSAAFVFTDIVNATGWESNGMVFFLGLLPGVTAVQGFDSAAHMSDELPNPSRQVPQVMMGNALLSAISAIPMIIVFMFCITNPGNFNTPVGGQPVAQLILDSFQSLPLTIVGMLIYIVVFTTASICITTTTSRVWWSFARDGGLPCSNWLGRVDQQHKLPVNALIFSLVINGLVGLLELGAVTALNAIIGTAVICFYVSYAIPITCLLVSKRKLFPKQRYFNLGIWGTILNVISLVWSAFVSIWLFFPLYLPVEAATMNYAVAVLAVVISAFALVWVFHAKKNFNVPVVIIEGVLEGRDVMA